MNGLKKTWARCASCGKATYVCANKGCKPATKAIDLNMTPKTSATVNAALKSLGVQERLVRGRGYWYFVDGKSSSWYSSSVPVYRITDGNMGFWLEQWLILSTDEANEKFEHARDGKLIARSQNTASWGQVIMTYDNVLDAIAAARRWNEQNDKRKAHLAR